tara:strand:- start:17 stop:361 length:345 start_codon:yes stop_codon:yes gene_type:complete
MATTVLPPKLEAIAAKYGPEVRSLLEEEIVSQKRKLQQEYFETAQGQTQATAPGRIGEKIAFQPRTMVNPANLPGLGGSLLQMSPPFDPSVRRQLQQGNRKREDELFGTRMFFT